MDAPVTFQQERWSLADLFASPQEAEQAFQEVEQRVAAIEAWRDKLTPDIPAGQFMALLREIEDLNRLAYRIHGYASLRFAENTQDQEAQNMLGKVRQFMALMGNRLLFFELWWRNLDEENAQRLMAEAGDYRYYLEKQRLYRPHTLSEAEEKIINLKDVTGVNALITLYSAITNRYVFRLEVDGEVKELTRGELMVYARHHDPDLRARAYQELYRVYGNDGAILGQMYQAVVRDWYNENVLLRRYASPISVRNLHNHLPDEVVDTLLAVCRDNAEVFRRFFRLKARVLGMDRLRRYDVYAPVAKSDKTYDFATAARMVLDAFKRFDPRIADLARRVFAEHHLDSEVRRGKRGGAFCSTVTPDLTPWVLVNYQGRVDDIATLAHELGHAIHSMLAAHHSLFTQHAPLPLAETASTFGEMILIDALLEQESDETVRRDILFRQVDDNYATILRQAYFALFEKQAHDMVQQGASVEDLAEAYMDNLRDQFDDAVALSDEFRWEWVSIPHIYHAPFYVYAYAFGQLLVLALYRRYKEEGEAFKERYINLLATGGSKPPMEMLAEAGVDVSRPEFWQGGFDIINGWIDQLEGMV
ncbi:MAG TPA: M3 family oligoendopeptidase [Anaerolineae bacterium]|nr:M3 family oligoendopeptidase [Anaerolineae bacterium]HID85619.1 M3 family oligoendopeptidase [Anaerolineales bacterium]HIQ08602.1 M3 family oligoendopeptidase [Anaerolineaceae bacterium]